LYCFQPGGGRPLLDEEACTDLRASRHESPRVRAEVGENSFRNSGKEVMDHLQSVWRVIQSALAAGLENHGVLPGRLGVQRRGPHLRQRLEKQAAKKTPGALHESALALIYHDRNGREECRWRRLPSRLCCFHRLRNRHTTWLAFYGPNHRSADELQSQCAAIERTSAMGAKGVPRSCHTLPRHLQD